MSKGNILIFSFALLVSVIIVFVLFVGDSIYKVHDRSSKNIIVSTTMMQTATVPCKDTENYGQGALRDRICAEGTTATCDWDDYQLPANDGTCTIDDDDGSGSDPEVEE